jgi:hypothetical protein
MNPELLEHMPKSFQLMANIESEAQRRAEQRFQEILRTRQAKT